MNKTEEVDNLSEDETKGPAAKRPRLSSNEDSSNPQITKEDVTVKLSGDCTRVTEHVEHVATASSDNRSALLSDETTSQSQCATSKSALHIEQTDVTSSDNGSALLSDETTCQSQCATSKSALHTEQTDVTSSDNGSALLSDDTTSQSQRTSQSALHTDQEAMTSSDNGSALLSDETTSPSQRSTSQSALHTDQEAMTSSANGSATQSQCSTETLENHMTIQVTPGNLQAASTQTNLLNRLPDCLPGEETNFLRFCHLILKVAEQAVRHRFDQQFPPGDLQSIIQKHKSKLLDLKIKRIITSSQWNQIFPTGSVPMSSTFDMTLMFCLFRHMTKISPKSGWYDSLPPPSDTSLGADLARIKYYRNNIAHYLEKDRKIDYAEFDIVWNDMSKTLGRIGGAEYAEKCSKLLTTNLDSSHLDIYRDLCIQQQEMLKDPVPYQERGFYHFVKII